MSDAVTEGGGSAPWYVSEDVTLYCGDAEAVLRGLPDGCAQTCVTSPPYFGLRDYGTGGAQVGLEETLEEYIDRLVSVFRGVRRVLADDGTLWLNLGDSYGKGKQLLGIPWRAAFALQADGWILRSDVIWAKPNPMPESVRDRPTKAHEYLFLLAKSPRYYYDIDAIREPHVSMANGKERRRGTEPSMARAIGTPQLAGRYHANGRNKRTVWTVTPRPYKGAHFATFPPDLIEPCILAGCPEGGVVLDPFIGSGTTAAVARANGRRCIGVDLNGEYLALTRARLEGS